ncbi:cytochrome P450 [Streptomyces sp. URMC 128]|uniref:cytochrome P450 n=1 Tax=Streptomyces sp. URMC 128 TaxID=3423404 RepID=UPI003F19673F
MDTVQRKTYEIGLSLGPGGDDEEARTAPEAFADPDPFHRTRPVAAGRHLAFGSGMHGCAGQVLARAEADIVFSSIVNRFSGVEPAGEPACAPSVSSDSSDASSVPVRFENQEPSMKDDPNGIGNFCRDVMRRVATMTA